ncbi:TPA: DUF4123 domain-containing protein [Enterobacter kobei]|nr:DUF4123 domain-containing protein [Enterobacter kobei]HBO1178387.1 DUF4123 domain-containing protein [Enterobacter kobei]HBO1183338.1 DUF4123 domain-containing protein [Enterobacter kobei]HBO2010312.1 DUF4123 domain-containing protein [Enterobacter kobei]HBO2417908.1 DUF4123 domain-containing protein [Enterobacter kobei]
MINYLEQPLPLANHQYAVIDRTRVPELPESWPHIELVSPMLAPQAHLYPWLLPLHELPADEWRTFVTDLSRCTDPTSPPKCSLLLSSPRPIKIVCNLLVNALFLKDAYQKIHILRYYDPRVLFHLHWMLSPWQLFNHLPAQEIPHWTFWLEGEWHTLAFPDRVSCQPGHATEIPLAQLQRSGQINLTLEKLPRNVDMAQRQESSRKIDALLVQAMTSGLPTQEDRIAFALHGLVQPEGFWMAPKMAAFLAQSRQAPDYYRDVTSNWDEHFWQEMTQMQPYNNAWNN